MTDPSKSIFIICEGETIFSVNRSSKTASTPSLMIVLISLNVAGEGSFEIFADVLTIGFRMERINFKQIGSFVILIPTVPSLAKIAGAIPFAWMIKI